MRTAFLLLGAALLSAGSAVAKPYDNSAGEAKLAKALTGYVPAGKVDCLNLSDMRDQSIIDGTAILYRVGKRIYVNRPEGANFLRRDNVLISEPTGSQSCRLDIIRQRDNFSHFETGSISLNDFEVYQRAKP